MRPFTTFGSSGRQPAVVDLSEALVLLKINRLKKKNDFEKIFKKGKSFREDFLILRIVSNDLKINRFGFVVSRKVSKKASSRNKIKRRLRELVKLRLSQLKEGKDGILIACPGLEVKNFQEVEESLNKLFQKAGIIQKTVNKEQ